eukprot:SAG22_NODE_1912_length_3328_cov_1.207185_1_plen_288_part_00
MALAHGPWATVAAVAVMALAASASASVPLPAAQAAARETVLFDRSWRYSPVPAGSPFAAPARAPNDSLPLDGCYWDRVLNDTYATGPLSGASFDDSMYERVDAPHDFLINGTVNRSTPRGHGLPGNWPGGYPPGDFLPRHNGIYRKHFRIPAEWQAGRTIWLEFEGVWHNSKVWLNGVALGPVHSSGYTGFARRLDNCTALLRAGSENVLAVFVDGSHGTGWWYEVSRASSTYQPTARPLRVAAYISAPFAHCSTGGWDLQACVADRHSSETTHRAGWCIRSCCARQ